MSEQSTENLSEGWVVAQNDFEVIDIGSGMAGMLGPAAIDPRVFQKLK